MNEKFLPKFNKNTIETGMVLETEKGELFLVSEVNNELILINNENCKKLYDYNFYLQYFNHWDSVHNIIKAYKAKDYNKNNLNELLNKDNLNLIWYEDYKPKMTKKDIEQEPIPVLKTHLVGY